MDSSELKDLSWEDLVKLGEEKGLEIPEGRGRKQKLLSLLTQEAESEPTPVEPDPSDESPEVPSDSDEPEGDTGSEDGDSDSDVQSDDVEDSDDSSDEQTPDEEVDPLDEVERNTNLTRTPTGAWTQTSTVYTDR